MAYPVAGIIQAFGTGLFRSFRRLVKSRFFALLLASKTFPWLIGGRPDLGFGSFVYLADAPLLSGSG